MFLMIILLMTTFPISCQTLCPSLVLPKNAECSVGCRSRQSGAVCCCSCLTGYSLKGSASRICRNNVWSGIQMKCIKNVVKPKTCPPIVSLENGSINNTFCERFVIRCVLTFKCNDGFDLDGNQLIVCLTTGKWSADKPKCKPKPTPTPPPKCDSLPTTIRSYWVSNDNRGECKGDPGQTCRLRCVRGVIVGPTFVYCDMKSHEWSKPIPKCSLFI